MVKLKLLVLLLFAAFTAALLLTENAANPHARAYSAGPPAGYTHAPGELDCADCHTTPAQSTGSLAVNVPQTYTPGQTYDITVTHTTADPSRVRWGFELTALDGADERAGAFVPADDLTRVISGEGPFPAREYIEHTSKGTFPGQQNGATWTFRWNAPTEDVGPVTFYVAGNQANGDGNSSGDNIYFTFASANFQAPAPDYRVTVTPSARTAVRGTTVTYDVTVTPLGGFTGTVTLDLSGLPPDALSSFEPAAVQLNDASPKTSVLSVVAASGTPTGTSTLNVNARAGQLTRTAQATLNVVAASDADLAVTQTVSPNPAQTLTDIKYTITVTNHGPSSAQSIHLYVQLPTTIGNITEGVGGDRCQLVPAGFSLAYDCYPPSLPAGQSLTYDFTLRTPTSGILNSFTSVSALEHDPFPSNNTVTLALPVAPQAVGPSMTVPGLGVRTVVKGLDQPTSMVFVGPRDFFVLEKATGRVMRVREGVITGAVLDLAVNSASERGLLGVALHPSFANNGFVYLFWTESSTGVDTTAIDEVPLLGNRVDRFVWNGSALVFDRTLLRLRSLQTDAGQPSRGNHNGGVLRFGPDGKLYVMMGDNGRRGFTQNLPCGPTVTCPAQTLTPDDQFGGPEPDDAHFTGVILRLNDDGTTPSDNPYAQIPTFQTTPTTENIRRTFAYGVRNGFGMAFDPVGGDLWTQENGDDAFDEINRVESGFNGGWIQLMGPSSRVAEFKAIEVARGNSLQQNRWPPSNIADTPAEALARLYQLPGSHYTEPEFSWKYAVAPSPIGFAGPGMGVQNAGDLFVGASRTTLLGGYLMRFKLSEDRKHLATNDSRLADRVADNSDKFDLSESESLVVGRDFGITTDIRTDPSGGNLHVVSLSNGAVYEVFARPTLYVADLDGAQQTPPNASPARGTATIQLDKDERTARVHLILQKFPSSNITAVQLRGPAPAGQTGPVIAELFPGVGPNLPFDITPQQVADLKAGLLYLNVSTTNFAGGEIRGQFGPVNAPSIFVFSVAEPVREEGLTKRLAQVTRLGDTSEAATVEFTTSDGTATERGDYGTWRGTLRFEPNTESIAPEVFVTDDGLTEPTEFFNVNLSNPTGPVLLHGPTSVALTILDNDSPPPATNPIDKSIFFVAQHYRDFLNRDFDGAGLAFWTNEIEQCGSDAQCREVKRINVSAAFFLSIEFQESGYLIYRLYLESFGRQPRYSEFIQDSYNFGWIVVGLPGWEERIAANRRAFAERWVTRPDFRSAFDGISNLNYVNKLFERANVTPTTAERNALVAALDSGTKTRAQVLLDVADNAAFKQKELNRAFVLMEYFGYLRRNPDDPPDENLGGYFFWLGKLEEFGGNYINAEMVKAFISSDEYRARFGRP